MSCVGMYCTKIGGHEAATQKMRIVTKAPTLNKEGCSHLVIDRRLPTRCIQINKDVKDNISLIDSVIGALIKSNLTVLERQKQKQRICNHV